MESNYDEDLNDNTFFQILQQNHLELFEKATLDGWVICVPRSGSLPKYVLSHEDFFNHILIPSDELPETHFRSLNDKDVRICNRVVTVEPGNNSSPFSTHVLFEETFYTEDMLKYKILCIDSPLEQFPNKFKSQSDIVSIETLRDCIDLIWTESGSKDVLEKMDEAIKAFLLRNQRFEFKPIQIQKDLVSNLYIQCLQITMHDSRIREKASMNRHFLDNIKLSVESYVHHGIYKKLIKGVTACTAFEDSTFNKIVRNLSDIQLRDLDIRSDLSDTVPKARSELARVDGYSTVLGKVGCLKRTLAAISKQDTSNSKQGTVVAADDLLPMLVFLVIKSGLPNWIAHLTYMRQFNFSASNDVHVDQDSFLVTSLEAAIEHIRSGILTGPSSPESQQEYEEELGLLDSPLRKNSFECGVSKDLKNEGGECIETLTSLFDASRLGNEEEVERILKEFRDNNVETNDNDLCNPFCSCDKCKDKGFKNRGITLCHPLCSCDKCESQVSQKLKNTTPTVHSCDDRGYTALHIACMYGKPKIVDILLIYGANVHATDYSGATALHYASSRGHQNALLLLIHNGANINVNDNDGNTPLHFAASNGHEGCLKAVLYFSEHNGISLNINKKNNQGDTPLHNASRWGYEMIVKLLLNAGADPGIENKRKLTPVDYAHNLHIARLLRTKPTPSHVKLIVPHFKIDMRQDMPVAAASKVGLDFTDEPFRVRSPTSGEYPRTTEEIKKVERVLRCITHGDIRLACFYLGLEDHASSPRKKCHPLCDCKHTGGPDDLGCVTPSDALHVNICNVEGFTPLHFAVMHGHSDLVEILLDAGAIPNIQTRKNITPLHLACLHQRPQIVTKLLEAHCDLNCQDLSGNTPLHYACQVNNARLVKLLMEHSPNMALRNKKGMTALEEAEDKMNITVARLLSQCKTDTNCGNGSL
ncbi:ankyrin repeat domain-containing protein 27-like [Homalodisca vitripennis]|uniref:ankyrin repeat domain-containing protein 27-like n=1 Tax=Homalodisca vitripennis TaxID=197043 RepID=UPI001EEAC853|nr:ankyrin repeat domain-containing protein 27-like [Homalodisca vitripennis]